MALHKDQFGQLRTMERPLTISDKSIFNRILHGSFYNLAIDNVRRSVIHNYVFGHIIWNGKRLELAGYVFSKIFRAQKKD